MSSIGGLVAQGLLLGWSVAWPPGPINAEMIRRALARGFWPAFAVGAGASSGDFAWAVAVALGAGALADLPGVRPALATARVGSSVTTRSGHSAKAACAAKRAAAPGSSANRGAPTTRQPAQKGAIARASAGGGIDGLNSRGSSRTGAPIPSQTPFEPRFTSGPV